MRRFLAILLIAALAAPGTWVRSSAPYYPPMPADGWTLRVSEVPLATRNAGSMTVRGAWSLSSGYPGFGAYSALSDLGDGRFIAASDSGRMLIFSPPGSPSRKPVLDWFAYRREGNKYLVDIEGMTRDPDSGRIWLAYEGLNAIERLESDFSGSGRTSPPAMRDWPGNTGPEGMVRLADGRFIVVSESHEGMFGGGFAGLLFPSDPVDGAEPIQFELAAHDGFRPVDIAALADGRVLVLMRSVTWFPPGFENRILVADPADIREGEEWRGREIGAIAAPLPTENYEGMVVQSLPDGGQRIWLISDDNVSALQRTLLMELYWDGR